jgi:hypothetical protein
MLEFMFEHVEIPVSYPGGRWSLADSQEPIVSKSAASAQQNRDPADDPQSLVLDLEGMPRMSTVKESDRHFRIFRDAEEIAIREFLIANYRIPGGPFTNEWFRRIGMQAFFTSYKQFGSPPEVNCSTGLSKTSSPGKASAPDARTTNGGRQGII